MKYIHFSFSRKRQLAVEIYSATDYMRRNPFKATNKTGRAGVVHDATGI